MRYRWSEITTIPLKPGVYAWYYLPEITDYDLHHTIEKLRAFKENNEVDSASELIKHFLYQNIFSYFQEDPYNAFLTGALKPQYEGKLEHKPSISQSLIDRIVENPERLATVKKILEVSAPDFASPLYIGMSNKLGKRLKTHKKLIEKYRSENLSENRQQELNYVKTKENKESYDKSFALEVCRRNIPPSRLFVIINILDEDIEKNYLDIENILNRIHYPLLGRN
jgi:hypothetical protein